jgi:hypothetical protein
MRNPIINPVAGFGEMPSVVRFLLVNHLLGNLGFYLLVPYLATYVTGSLGLGFAVAGLVLGIRNLSHQGLFLIGGTTTDRLGPRVMILSGTTLRAVGFGLFVIADSLPALLAAAVLTGVAGALFNPAVRTYISLEAGPERLVDAFALFSVFGQAGALLGPVLGAVLVAVDFRLSAAVSAVVFALLALAQTLLLAHRPAEATDTSVLGDWGATLRDRRFLAFTLALSGLYALQNQLYLVVPNDVVRLTGSSDGVALVFVVSTLLTIFAQMPVSRRLAAYRARGPAMAGGLAVMGLGFLPPAFLAGAFTGPVAGLVPVLLTGAALAIGVMVVQPFAYELINAFGDTRTTGTRFGFFYLVSGIVAAASTAALGAATDHWGAGAADHICAFLGLACALGVWLLHRAGLLPGTREDEESSEVTQ